MMCIALICCKLDKMVMDGMIMLQIHTLHNRNFVSFHSLLSVLLEMATYSLDITISGQPYVAVVLYDTFYL